MRKFLLNVIFLTPMLFSFLLMSTQLSAQSNASPGSTLNNLNDNFTIPNPTKYNSLEDIINALTSLIRPLFIITLGAMVLYGGWVRLTAQDNADKVKSSSQIIVGALVGFGIAVFAPTILDFAGRLLGVQGGLIQN